MIKKETKHKAGDLLIVTSGAYSDYGIEDVVQVLKDFDEKDFTREFEERWKSYRIDIPLLVTQGFIKPLLYKEMWKGDH